MLFKETHKEMILNGTKTATRRNWKKPMVKVGGIYQCKLKMLSLKCKLCDEVDFKINLKKHLRKKHNIHNKLEVERNIVSDYFAKIKVIKLYRQKLRDMRDEDAKKEGYSNVIDFKDVWVDINKEWNPYLVVYVIEFEVKIIKCVVCGGKFERYSKTHKAKHPRSKRKRPFNCKTCSKRCARMNARGIKFNN